MTVRTYLTLDCESQTGDVYKPGIEGNFAVFLRIAGAFAPHEQASPNMTVRVEAGPLPSDDGPVEVAAQSTGTITAPATYPRIDRVVVDQLTGAVSVITGAEAASPVAPVIPAGKLPVCQVALATSTTAIDNSLLIDERVLMVAPPAVPEAVPPGAFYFNLTGVDPATELGYGTWVEAPAFAPNSSYPPVHNATYVKTAHWETNLNPYYATDPAKTLTGTQTSNQWLCGFPGSQRFHFDLGAAKLINRLYYENAHDSGVQIDRGAKNFTLWGSNNAAAFAELTYGTDTNWTQIGGSWQFAQHTGSNVADPKYISVVPVTAYRYYAIKIADNWGDPGYLGLRRLELQFGNHQWLRVT